MTDHGHPFAGIGEAILASGGNTKWPDSQTIDGLVLRCTCSSHPEQYDVYDGETQVAYFRLRHGYFRVDVPDCRGETIYEAKPNGDGLFDAAERQRYLTEAVASVKAAIASPCVWEHDDTHEKWDTNCGEAWQLTSGSPIENDMKFCPFCGDRIVEA